MLLRLITYYDLLKVSPLNILQPTRPAQNFQQKLLRSKVSPTNGVLSKHIGVVSLLNKRIRSVLTRLRKSDDSVNVGGPVEKVNSAPIGPLSVDQLGFCPKLLKKRKKEQTDQDDRIATPIVSLFLTFQSYRTFLGFDFEGWIESELDDVVVTLYGLDCLLKLEKTLKEFCSWPMAKLLKSNEITDKSNQVVFGRSIRRIIMSRIHSHITPEQISFCQAFLQMKRCFAPVSDEFVQLKMLEHAEGVGSEFISVPLPEAVAKNSIGDYIVKNFSSIQRYALCKLEAYFDEHSRGLPDNLDEILLVPSTSASFSSSRQKGGFAQDILDVSTAALGELILPPEPADWSTPFFRQDTGQISQYYDYDSVMSVRPELQNTVQHGIRLISEIATMCAADDLFVNARIAAVKEPCKARIVSCGDALRYADAFRWDKLIRLLFKRCKILFTLRRTIKTYDLRLCYSRGKEFWAKRGYQESQLHFLSGDYSAATDGLDPEFSIRILNSLMRVMNIPQYQRQNLRDCLVHHDMHYPSIPDNTNELGYRVVRQKRGQLMGSPVSFPILCLINLLVNWMFIDPELECSVDELPILVNGDDLFMVIPKDYYDGVNRWTLPAGELVNWRYFVKTVGFTESLGKNYISDTSFCINSQFYYVDRKPFSITLVDYVRLSLIMGGGRVQRAKGQDDKYELAIEDKLKLFKRSPYDFYSDDVMSSSWGFDMWKIFNGEIIEFYQKEISMSYRLPSFLGGIGGLKDYDGLSDFDKCFAGWILRDHIQVSSVFSTQSTRWVSSRHDYLNKVMAESENLEMRFGNSVESLFGSEYREVALTSLFLEKLDIVEAPHTVQGLKVLKQQFRQFATRLRSLRKKFLKIKHSVHPIARCTYESVWEQAPSFDWFLHEESCTSLIG